MFPRCGQRRKAARGHACCCARTVAAMSSARCITHRKAYGHVAKAVGCRALIVNYGRAPENIHPGPVDDMVKAYRWLLDQGIQSSHIAFIGDSAGGGLAVTTILRAREKGLPLPAATMPLSPWLDMDARGETFETNRERDVLVSRDVIATMADTFLGEGGNRNDPLANPLHADTARPAADVYTDRRGRDPAERQPKARRSGTQIGRRGDAGGRARNAARLSVPRRRCAGGRCGDPPDWRSGCVRTSGSVDETRPDQNCHRQCRTAEVAFNTKKARRGPQRATEKVIFALRAKAQFSLSQCPPCFSPAFSVLN